MKRLLLFTMILSMGILQMFSQEATSLRTRLFSSEMQQKSATVDVDYKYIPKSPGHYSAEDWHEVLDSMYGPGLPTADKLAIFDEVWQTIDEKFAGFHGLDLDWDAVRDEYRPRVADTDNPISRGRFIALLNNMLFRLNALDTYVDYGEINYVFGYPLQERHGLPIFNTSGRYGNTHFGAALTLSSDSSIFVFKSYKNHPIGLVPGDIVLGYDGILWEVLIQQLMDAELILDYSAICCGTKSTIDHNLLTSAGMNWHLFDTIDIVKYQSGDTMHFSTSLLAGQEKRIYGNEQLKLNGVAWPDSLTGEISWGILEETRIGYIYALGSSNVAQNQFYDAIKSLMDDKELEGIIIDTRANYGGYYKNYNKGLSLLFNDKVETVTFNKRCVDPNDHLRLCPNGLDYSIPSDPSSYFEEPIAVLTGPGSIVGAELMAYCLKKHPKVKTFGKRLPGSLWTRGTKHLTQKGWNLNFAESGAFEAHGYKSPLFRTTQSVDSAVWFTQETALQGIDNVVKAAKEWIISHYHAPDVVVNAMPENNMNNEDIPAKLKWTKSDYAKSYNVYISKDMLIDEEDLVANTVDTTFIKNNLDTHTEYYWRVDAVNFYGIAPGELWKFTTRPGNVALNKSMIVSSENEYYPANKALDGNNGSDGNYIIDNKSRWFNDFSKSYPHWLKVDLGDSYKISSFKIFTGTSGYNSPLNDFKFQYHDGIEWVDAYSVSENTEAVKYVKLENPISGVDSVRLWITKSFEDKVRLYEFEVYGESDVAIQSVRSSDFELYPNPTTHAITLKTRKSVKAFMQIIQLDGKMIYECTMNGTKKEIDLSEFPTGIYFITIKSDDYIWTKRFVKL